MENAVLLVNNKKKRSRRSPRGPSCFLFAHMGSKHTWHTATAAAGSGAPAQFTDDFCSLETALLSEAGEAALERRTPDLAFIVR